MRMIYMSHPYTGEEEKNKADAREMQESLSMIYPSSCIINPLDTFAGASAGNDEEYVKILACCLELLGRCDAILMCQGWRTSTGCKAEYALAMQKEMEVIFE